MVRSDRLEIPIKNIYTLWGRKRFFLTVIYFPTNLVSPFTLRVTGINIYSDLMGFQYLFVYIQTSVAVFEPGASWLQGVHLAHCLLRLLP